ncbi:mycofactocin precursor MftA [Streptomyces spiralis]
MSETAEVEEELLVEEVTIDGMCGVYTITHPTSTSNPNPTQTSPATSNFKLKRAR